MRKLLKCRPVSPIEADQYTFVNPVADAGVTRVGLVYGFGAISLVAIPPRPGAPAEYPVGEGYRVEFPLITVPGVSSWLLAQFGGTLVEDPFQDPPEITSFRARLHDGTDHFIWTAGTWAVVSDVDVDWNSLEEVAHGLVDWDPETPFGLVVELQTTDARFAPALRGYTLMYEVDLPSEFDDWLHGAIVGGLADDVRPEKDVQVQSDGTTTIDFGDIEERVEDGWEFDEIVSVFNLTNDPFRRFNLLVSFDSGTRIATLTAAPAVDDLLLLRVTYVPVVSVNTDQDYIELNRGVNIMLTRVEVKDYGEASEGSYIMDEYVDPPEATLFPAPRRSNIEIDLTITAPLTVDTFRLSEAVTKWLNDHRTISSPTTGEEITLRVVDPMEPIQMPDRAGIRALNASFVLENVYFHHRDPVTVGDGSPGSAFAHGVTNVQVASSVGSATVDTEVGG